MVEIDIVPGFTNRIVLSVELVEPMKGVTILRWTKNGQYHLCDLSFYLSLSSDISSIHSLSLCFRKFPLPFSSLLLFYIHSRPISFLNSPPIPSYLSSVSSYPSHFSPQRAPFFDELMVTSEPSPLPAQVCKILDLLREGPHWQ